MGTQGTGRKIRNSGERARREEQASEETAAARKLHEKAALRVWGGLAAPPGRRLAKRRDGCASRTNRTRAAIYATDV